MKMSKVLLLALCGMLCIGILSCASGPKPIPNVDWEWLVNGDADNGGTSTIEMASVTQDGAPAYKFTGTITNEWEYGNVYVKVYPDPATLESFKTAAAISFRMIGDGEQYTVEIATSDIEDYCYYAYAFDTVDGVAQTVIIPVEYFVQHSWGKQVGFMVNLDLVQFIQFERTNGGNVGPIEFTLWDLKLWNTVPTEKDIVGSKPKAAAPAAAAKGVGGDLGALDIKLADNFQYGESYQGVFTDKRLMNGHKIVPGETFTLKITFTASRDLEEAVFVALVDTTPAANYWRWLAGGGKDEGADPIPASHVKAGEQVSATITLTTVAGATGTSGSANALVFLTNGEGKKGVANSGVQKAVTLTFTEFVFTQE